MRAQEIHKSATSLKKSAQSNKWRSSPIMNHRASHPKKAGAKFSASVIPASHSATLQKPYHPPAYRRRVLNHPPKQKNRNSRGVAAGHREL
jgi:hypothetical protein